MPLHFWGLTEAERIAGDVERNAAREARTIEADAETVVEEAKSSETVGYAVGLLGWAIAGTVFVAVKYVQDEMPPWTMAWARAFLTALILTPFFIGHFRDLGHFLRQHWAHALIIGAIGLGVTQGTMFSALHQTTAINAVIVFALSPILTMVLARLFLAEAMSAIQWLGVLVAFAGVVTVTVQGDLERLAGLQIGFGELLALVAALLFAIYTVALKHARFKLDRIQLLSVMLFGGALGAAPFALWEFSQGAHENLARNGYLALVYMAVIGGAGLYTLFNWSVEILGAGRAGALVYTNPIFVAIFAWLVLGEQLEWYHYVGAAIIAVGVVLILRGRPTPKPPTA
ncbi:MAG: DMT family transporter [Rhodobacteraceae bacterium]|nr:DMT family transporter [Paracoccaceae bacterium]